MERLPYVRRARRRDPGRKWSTSRQNAWARASLSVSPTPPSTRQAPSRDGRSEEQRRKAQSQREHCLQLQKGLYYPFRRFSDLTAPVTSFLQKLGPADNIENQNPVHRRGTGHGTRSARTTSPHAAGMSVAPGAPGISLVPLFNVTPGEIFAAINREQPSIVHLSGRQNGGRILLHDEKRKLAPFDADLLAQSLARTTSRSLKLVVSIPAHR